MNLGKDTGRLDGRISSSSREKNNNHHDDNDNDDNDIDNDEKDKSNGKRLRMSLQKGEVKQNIFIVFPLYIFT